MKTNPDDFFDQIDYASMIENIKNVYTSDGTMSTLMDFERVLDDADLYAFQNWDLGELASGPVVKKYSVKCMFCWPYKLMPDPRGAKRLLLIGAKLKFKKTKIRVPVAIKTTDDYMSGSKLPKLVDKKIWLIEITLPVHLMDSIREGSIDLANQTIDLADIDEAYDDDLQTDDQTDDEIADQDNAGMPLGGMSGGPDLDQQPMM